MRRPSVLLIGVFALAACGEREVAPAPAQTQPVVEAAPAKTLTGSELRRVCRAGLAAIHGQQPEDIEIGGVEDGVVHAMWRAPVNGGLMRADCRVEGDRIQWKPLNLPDPSQIRWMDQAGDPVVRFVLNGDAITVTQRQAGGASQQTTLTVPAPDGERG